MFTTPKPTQAELEVLQVLWQRGDSTVRDVHEELSATHTTGYTTVLKIMQIMYEKGLLERDESARAHVYSSVEPQSETQGRMVSDLVSKVFEGSTSKLVVSALHGKATKKEIAEIREILNELERK
ncbi:BlaI/MecI/CopY family transcriptional regulator [Aliikangiella sp. IMCC44359]|uniref:BlaI/MecI/CopY family transcriptional regulator n=1 Tax=Aliikangiella sp. IMCC44359 TaxID=3459125 RepID=UPI00403AD693